MCTSVNIENKGITNGGVILIDFTPLHNTLKEKGMTMSDMRDTVLSSKTLSKINKNDGKILLSSIEKICIHLDVPLEKVVRITK